MKPKSFRQSLPLMAVIVPLVALHLHRPDTSSFWLQTFFEWMHVLVFAVVAIGLYQWLGKKWKDGARASFTIFGAPVLAVLSEAAQIPTARDASWSDIGSDVIGATIGLLLIPAVTARFFSAWVSRLTAIVLLVISASSVIHVTALYVERNNLFPVIYDERWPKRSEFMAQRNMAIDFRNMVPDWRGYESLFIDLEVFGELPFTIVVRVHDWEHRRGSQPTSDRFNRQFKLEPGRSQLVIPLEDIASAPKHRRLDLSQIDGLVLFSNEDADKYTVRLHEIRLN